MFDEAITKALVAQEALERDAARWRAVRVDPDVQASMGARSPEGLDVIVDKVYAL